MIKDLPLAVRTCTYLKLVPRESDRALVEAHLSEARQPGNSKGEQREYEGGLIGGRHYTPICNQDGCLCVVAKSPIRALAQGHDLSQPLGDILENANMISSCEDKEMPEWHDDGHVSLSGFLMDRIVVSGQTYDGSKTI
jgi:hypothetical protein